MITGPDVCSSDLGAYFSHGLLTDLDHLRGGLRAIEKLGCGLDGIFKSVFDKLENKGVDLESCPRSHKDQFVDPWEFSQGQGHRNGPAHRVTAYSHLL